MTPEHRRQEWISAQVVDTHTEGEPTRVVLAGGPALMGTTLAEQKRDFQQRFDAFRSAVVNEPRGCDVLVGALVCPPVSPGSVAGVVFFNNVGYLSMCGHGTIGLIVALAHVGRIGPGEHWIDTPVGRVQCLLEGANRVTVENVPSYRYRSNVPVNVAGIGRLHGDIAWGGNWFFLCEDHGQELNLARSETLVDLAWQIRLALRAQRIGGPNGEEIDHIELMGPPHDPRNDARNFVLCPGKAYDRSPCGTGTSAKVACLMADGRLAAGEVWRQESLLGTCFEASGRIEGEFIIPRISGRAFVTSEATLQFQPDDPFRYGIRFPLAGTS